MRLAFLGTSAFAAPALQALASAGHDIVAVYTRRPKPAGRGHHEQKTPVHLLAESLGLPVSTPRTLRDPEEASRFAALDLDAAVVVAYGHILTAPFLGAPVLGCYNIHGSLLPRWRGAAPIQRALLAGDDTTGVTIIRMDEGLDTGPMVLAEQLPIRAGDTGRSLHDALSGLGARLIVAALDGIVGGSLVPVPQPAGGVTYAHKLGREESALDWRRPAAELERKVRAFDPWPGTHFELAGERIKVLGADLALAAGAPGTVIAGRDGFPIVACASGGLRLTRLQRASRAAQPGDAFLRGLPQLAGSVLPPPPPAAALPGA
jgi:methionyl-tRNA formyltransferase